MSHVHFVVGPKPHAHSVWLYWLIFFALVALTTLTVYLSHFDFGELSIIVTLLIASTKADNKFLALVASTSLIFLSLLIIFCIFDINTRGEVEMQTENFLPREEKVYKHKIDNPQALPLRPRLEEASPEKLIFVSPDTH
jgi:cytochrome c oxidase subunit 4